jgi:hypothetical protein
MNIAPPARTPAGSRLYRAPVLWEELVDLDFVVLAPFMYGPAKGHLPNVFTLRTDLFPDIALRPADYLNGLAWE